MGLGDFTCIKIWLYLCLGKAIQILIHSLKVVSLLVLSLNRGMKTRWSEVSRLSYSPQLKTLVNTALAQGKKVDLIVSETNKYISGPLEAAIRSTGGWIIRVNSKTGGAKIL